MQDFKDSKDKDTDNNKRKLRFLLSNNTNLFEKDGPNINPGDIVEDLDEDDDDQNDYYDEDEMEENIDIEKNNAHFR